MPTNNTPAPLAADEQQFWDDSFNSAEFPLLLKGDTKGITPAGLAHLAADFADAAVIERRLRANS